MAKLTLSLLAQRIDAILTGGAATWGAITGTLSAQTDLNAALGAKAATSYVNSQDAAVTTAAGVYADSVAATAESNANTYTDAAISAAPTFQKIYAITSLRL
jgi:hypothetical protein